MTSAPVFSQILRYGAVLAVGVALIGSVIGWFADPDRGVVSALIGAAVAFVFLGVTAGSILLAGRLTKWDILNPAFLVTVMGGWLLKFIAFLVIVVLLKDQPWINTLVFFLSVIVSVIGSLVIDMVVIAKSRIPLVELPAAPVDEE
jgi:hypothetical protein